MEKNPENKILQGPWEKEHNAYDPVDPDVYAEAVFVADQTGSPDVDQVYTKIVDCMEKNPELSLEGVSKRMIEGKDIEVIGKEEEKFRKAA